MMPRFKRQSRRRTPEKEESENRPMQFFGSNSNRQALIRLNSMSVEPSDFERQGLRAKVLEKGLTAFRSAVTKGETASFIFTIIDFEMPSTEKRMWVINLDTGDLLFHEQVTHGMGSDRNHDGRVDPGGLSNRTRSKQSNIGLLRTAETYYSSKFKGTSLRMDGLEDGFNDGARERAIVMHPADYADVEEGEKPGRSHGCPALDPDVSGDIIQTIKGGSLIFQYYPDPQWLERSNYLK